MRNGVVSPMWNRAASRIIILSLALLGFRGSGLAQSERLADRPHIELDYDLRTRFPSQGKTRTELTDRSFRVNSSLGSGLKLAVYGADKYGSFLMQQATIEKDVARGRLQAGIIRLPFGIYDYRVT